MDTPRKLVKTTIPEATREDPETPRQYVETPYIKGASERVGKLFKNHNIILSNKSTLSETSSAIWRINEQRNKFKMVCIKSIVNNALKNTLEKQNGN